MKYALAGLACLAALLGVDVARADETPKRTLPNYDGRGGAPQTLGRKLLWVPRVVLSPLYFVSEFVIRRPIGAAMTAAEKAELPAALYDFFAFGPNHTAGIVPIALVDFGFNPSVGLYAFWDDAGFKGHELRLRGSTWGRSWLSGTATERFVFGDRVDFTLTGTATRRPDYVYYGIGPDTRESALTRYSSDSLDAHGEVRLGVWKSSTLTTAFGYRAAKFGHSDYHDGRPGTADYEPSLDDEVAAGRADLPPGFRDGYRAPFARARLVLDSRRSEASSSGVRLDVSAEQGVDLERSHDSSWLRYAATLGGFWDLGDSARVVSLSVSALLSEPRGSGAVPFTELATLGGNDLMPGFRPGRLYDRSALVTTLRYSWPIWIWLNGSLQAAVGNVYGERWSGFRLERARFSAALGMESSGSRDSVFQALVGFGSETFESGGKVDSLRIVVGARHGF
jgi:hypothetical protein